MKWKTAICIRTGNMHPGHDESEPFCTKGKIYKYHIKPGDYRYPYFVDTDSSYNHQMGEGFFINFFAPVEEFFLDEKLFDI